MDPASSLRRSRRWRSVLTLLLIAGGLGGCVEDAVMPEAQVGPGDIRNAIAKGQLTSPRAATVALASLDGAPPAVEARFRQALSGEAAAREIAMTDAASARYLLRGYLSAYPGEQGVTIAYTYDVFDAAAKRRHGRVADTVDVPGDAADPWSAVNDAVLASIVGRSADDLAVALSAMPEAQAAAAVAAAPASVTPVN